MVHVLAVAAFGLVCVVWAWVQLASGNERGGSCGACGLGRGPECDCPPGGGQTEHRSRE